MIDLWLHPWLRTIKRQDPQDLHCDAWDLNSCSGEIRSFVRPIAPQSPRFQQNMSFDNKKRFRLLDSVPVFLACVAR